MPPDACQVQKRKLGNIIYEMIFILESPIAIIRKTKDNDKGCDVSSARLSDSPSLTTLVLDSSVVLNQIDLLENPAMDNVVVLSLVLSGVKNKNISVYNRLKALYLVFAMENPTTGTQRTDNVSNSTTNGGFEEFTLDPSHPYYVHPSERPSS
ncbi:hypothetical protein FXO37_13821 [Capsicum annuum]|nr:hypothetical protein FXO37_13821 [Capsicum annuum]